MRIKVLGLAVVAAFALSAIASATAMALPEIVNSKGVALAAGTKITDRSGKSVLETIKGSKITCEKDKSAGEVTGARTAKNTITFEGCTAFGLGCNTSGKVIEIHVTSTVVYLNEKEKTVGIVLALEKEPTITCGGVQKLKVRGDTICPVSPVNTLTKVVTLACKQTKGVQEPLEYEEGGKKVKPPLNETEASGFPEKFAFTQSGLTSADELEFGSPVEEVEVKA
jgi:hypothetical protein